MNTKQFHQLCSDLTHLKTQADFALFLKDLCTPGELRAFTGRWGVAEMLTHGVPYRKIYEKTGVSTATVTRVARCLADVKGGYNMLIERKRKKQT